MKILVLCLLCSFDLSAQLNLNVLGSIDFQHERFDYFTLQDTAVFYNGFSGSDKDYRLEIQLEYQVTERLSVISGIHFFQHNNRPEAWMGLFGLPIRDETGNSTFISDPYVETIQIHGISLPVFYKYKFKPQQQLRFFVQGGALIHFQIQQNEKYTGGLFQNNPTVDFPSHTIKHKDFRWLGSVLEFDLGLEYQVHSEWAILLQTGVNLMEYRRRNVLHHGYTDEDVIWKERLLPLGGLVFKAGIQKRIDNFHN